MPRSFEYIIEVVAVRGHMADLPAGRHGLAVEVHPDPRVAREDVRVFVLRGAGGAFVVELLATLTWSKLLNWHLGAMGLLVMLAVLFFPDGLRQGAYRLPALASLAGRHTFTYKQSSAGVTPNGAASPGKGSCMQSAPYALAARTPDQACAGCGGFQRNSPTGGEAYGIPLNATTPPSIVPCTAPVSTVARSLPAHAEPAAASSSASVAEILLNLC